MNAAAVLVAEISAVGADATLENGVLCISAPEGALTEAQYRRLIEHRADIIALLAIALLAEPANDRCGSDDGEYGSDDVLADLQAVFAGDGPANHAAAERLAKAKGPDRPVGDDLLAWQGWAGLERSPVCLLTVAPVLAP